MTKLDKLNMQVTSAIVKMEEAAKEVARLEEEIATLVGADTTEGAVARRGAVRATLASGNVEYARLLINKFSAEDNIDPKLDEELWQLLWKWEGKK